ncbi:uncharacterized protein AMSG_11625 [Thecamonas trahens ATCC 50062]|uniref:Uncharacterized protein n=1 Tax=Thecamonas trahens ATCC 50062 TaxID=461836 RepID=A0A0L0DEW4_THETB|nr:hypothetical protein AMSG_11625 [Thecamonas trahens ATCC 50062]KNC50681.1 hypothetical protein AMSG_11625 [Thecamonas trahens ATCC 50062]|eukprot:XP_013762604.1 hypothetical protein AMSG_11625 [Thecamonas trahens ATCC 50062]
MASIATGFAESGHLPAGDYVLHVANFSNFVGRFEYSFVRQSATDVTCSRGEEETISPGEEWWHKFSVNAPSTFFSLQLVSSDGIAVEIIQLCSAVDLALAGGASTKPAPGGLTASRSIELPDGNYILRVNNASGQKASVAYSVTRRTPDGSGMVLSAPVRELQAQSDWWRKFVVQNASPALTFTLDVTSTGNTFEEVLLLGPILILDPFPIATKAEAGAAVPCAGVVKTSSGGAFAFCDETKCFNYEASKFSELATLSQFQAYKELWFPPGGPHSRFQLFDGPSFAPLGRSHESGWEVAHDGGGVLASLDDIRKFLQNPYMTANNYTAIALTGTVLTPSDIDRLGEYLTSTLITRRISALVLAGSHIDDERLIRLLSGISPVLNYLDLSDNLVTDNGVVALSALLATSDYNLQYISLRGNAIENLGAAALSDALTRNATLLALDLSDNAIGLDGAKQLQEGIRINHSLRSANLAGNAVGADVVDLLGRLAPNRLVDHVQWSWRCALDARGSRASAVGPDGGRTGLGAPRDVVAISPGRFGAQTPLYVLTFAPPGAPTSAAADRMVVVRQSELEPGTMAVAEALAAGRAFLVPLPEGQTVATMATNASHHVAVATFEATILVYSGLSLLRALDQARSGGSCEVASMAQISTSTVAPCLASSAQVLMPRFAPRGAARSGAGEAPTPAARLQSPAASSSGAAPWTEPQTKESVPVVAFAWVPVLETVPCEAAVLYADGTPAIVSGGTVSALGCTSKRPPVSGVVSLAWGIAPMAQSHVTPRAVLAMGLADGRVVLQRPASAMLLGTLSPPDELRGVHAAAHLRFLGSDVWLVGFVARSGSYVFALVHLRSGKGGAVAARWRVLGPQLFPVASAASLRRASQLTHVPLPVALFSQLADAPACVKVSLSLPFPRLLVLGSSISPDVEVLTSTPHSDPLQTWRACALPNSTLFSPPSAGTGPTASQPTTPRVAAVSAASPPRMPVDFEDGMLAARCFPIAVAAVVDPAAGDEGRARLLPTSPRETDEARKSREPRDGPHMRYEYEYEYEYDESPSGGDDDLRRHAVYSRRTKPGAVQRTEQASNYANLSTVETLHHLRLELPCVRVSLVCVLLSGHVLEYEFVVRQEKPVDQGPIKGDTYDLFASYQVARKRLQASLQLPQPIGDFVDPASIRPPPHTRSSALDYVDHAVGGLFDRVAVSPLRP